MKTIKYISFILAGTLFFSSHALTEEKSDREQASPDKKIQQWTGHYGSSEIKEELLAGNSKQWRLLWQKTGREPEEVFDDSKDMAAGIFLGTRRTGGYGIVILSAKEEGEKFVIDYLEIKPAGVTTQALTTPYLIMLFPETDREVIFRKWDHIFYYLSHALEVNRADATLSNALLYSITPGTSHVTASSKNIHPKTVEALIEALKILDQDVRVNAVWSLESLGQLAAPALPVLINVLNDENAEVRNFAVYAIGNIGGDPSQIIPVLTNALQDKSKDVRAAAAVSLGRFGPSAKGAVPGLIIALEDPDWVVRRNAAISLGMIGPDAKDAVRPLIEHFKDRDYDEVDSSIPYYSAVSLGQIGPAAIPALLKSFNDKDVNVRRMVVIALGNIKSDPKRTVPVFITATGDKDSEVRRLACVALGELGPRAKSAREALKKRANDKDWGVKNAAAIALERLNLPG
ncbi:MAG: HEAT repeat domain-containing protein [Candidatus Omnitrophica bacterium]|nr:HEAT repeat domain-containing protein [Candidatus Omnitrophota bacterium]